MTLRRVGLLFAFVILPQTALADLLERYEVSYETFAFKFNRFAISRVPELEGHLPPAEWVDTDRAIGRCILDTYEAELGAAAVEAHVVETETAIAAIQMTSMQVIQDTITTLSADEVAVRAGRVCGQVERSQELLNNSGLTEIFRSNPEYGIRLNE